MSEYSTILYEYEASGRAADLKASSIGEPQDPIKKESFHIASRLNEIPKVTIFSIIL